MSSYSSLSSDKGGDDDDFGDRKRPYGAKFPPVETYGGDFVPKTDTGKKLVSLFRGVPPGNGILFEKYVAAWYAWCTALYRFKLAVESLDPKYYKRSKKEDLPGNALLSKWEDLLLSTYARVSTAYRMLWERDENKKGKEFPGFPYGMYEYPPWDLLMVDPQFRVGNKLPGRTKAFDRLSKIPVIPGNPYPTYAELNNNNNNNNAVVPSSSLEENKPKVVYDEVEKRILSIFRGAMSNPYFDVLAKRYLRAWKFWMLSIYATKRLGATKKRLKDKRKANRVSSLDYGEGLKYLEGKKRTWTKIRSKKEPSKKEQEVNEDLAISEDVLEDTYAVVVEMYRALWSVDPNHDGMPIPEFPYARDEFPHYDLIHVGEFDFNAGKEWLIKARAWWNKKMGKYHGDYTADPRFEKRDSHMTDDALDYPRRPRRDYNPFLNNNNNNNNNNAKPLISERNRRRFNRITSNALSMFGVTLSAPKDKNSDDESEELRETSPLLLTDGDVLPPLVEDDDFGEDKAVNNPLNVAVGNNLLFENQLAMPPEVVGAQIQFNAESRFYSGRPSTQSSNKDYGDLEMSELRHRKGGGGGNQSNNNNNNGGSSKTTAQKQQEIYDQIMRERQGVLFHTPGKIALPQPAPDFMGPQQQMEGNADNLNAVDPNNSEFYAL